jgi:hypothetical protein
LLEDTSEIFCAKEEEIAGHGPVGASKNRQIGFHLHSVLGVRWPGGNEEAPRRPAVEMIGLVDQQSHVRQPRAKEEKDKRKGSERRMMAAEELESALWEKASQRIGPAPSREDVVWVKVGDRGADIYDHLYACQQQSQRFVIRAKSDRALVTAAGEAAGNLFAAGHASPSLGELSLELRAWPGSAARTAQMQVSVTKVMLRAPAVAGHSCGRRPPIACAVVRVWEVEAPAGVEALQWFLLTDLPVEDFAGACEIAQMYATRWLEEEFHKALKTGMGLERLQLTTARAWFAVTAVMSIVALRLLRLRETVRRTPEAPAEAADLSELELKVLRVRSGKPLSTVREVALALGRLGGHLNRKSDGNPGWITLWRGWQELRLLVEGALLASKLTEFT